MTWEYFHSMLVEKKWLQSYKQYDPNFVAYKKVYT